MNTLEMYRIFTRLFFVFLLLLPSMIKSLQTSPKLYICAKIKEIVYKGLQSNYIGLPSHTDAMSCSLSLDNHPR